MSEPEHSNLPLIASVIAVVLVVLGLSAWFVWPLPELRAEWKRESILSAFSRNDLDVALAQTDDLLANNPDDVFLLITKALTLAQKGSLYFKEAEYGAQAESVARAALDLAPESSEAWRALAYSYEIRQDYAKAHEYYAKVLALNPNNTLALFGDAHAYDLQGDLVKAEAGYRAAIAANPAFDQAHMGLARILFGKGEDAEAIAELEEAYELAANLRNKAEAAYSLGMISFDKNDVSVSVAHMQDAVTLDPQYPLAWYGLGAMLLRQAFYDPKFSEEESRALAAEGVTHLEKALSLNPNQTLAYIELARFQALILNKPKEAFAFLDQAQATVPKDITLSASGKEIALETVQELRRLFERAP